MDAHARQRHPARHVPNADSSSLAVLNVTAPEPHKWHSGTAHLSQLAYNGITGLNPWAGCTQDRIATPVSTTCRGESEKQQSAGNERDSCCCATVDEPLAATARMTKAGLHQAASKKANCLLALASSSYKCNCSDLHPWMLQAEQLSAS